MRALSIRQPYAELILRGIKKIEYRSRATRIVGERFWIYAAGKKWPGAVGKEKEDKPVALWSRDLGIETPEPWMVELANALRMFPHELPTGVIVGSAVIERCVPAAGDSLPGARDRKLGRSSISAGADPLPAPRYEWHLRDVERVTTLRKPKGHPQPVWFKPF